MDGWPLDGQRRRVESEFAGLLSEYSDDEIGELEDPQENEQLRGHVEVRHVMLFALDSLRTARLAQV